MAFSWVDSLARAKRKKMQRARQLAKNGNLDERIAHPDEYREAQQGKFTMLNKRVLEKFNKYNQDAMDRRKRIAGTG